MSGTSTEQQVMETVGRLGSHLIRAVSTTPRNPKTVRAGFSAPGVGGRGQGLKPVIVGTLVASWVEQIALVRGDAHLTEDGYAQQLVHAARQGIAVLEPAVAAALRTLNSNAQRELLVELAECIAEHVLPVLGGLEFGRDLNGWLYQAPHPRPRPEELANGSAVAVMVAAFAAGNHHLGEDVLQQVAHGPEAGNRLMAMTGWLARVAIVVLLAAYDEQPPTDPDDPRFPRPATDPALPDTGVDACDAVRRSITAVLAKMPAKIQRERAETFYSLDVSGLTAAVRYAAVTVARNAHAATEQAVRTLAREIDPDLSS